MLSSARRRAKIYNLQFDLTEDFIFDLIKNNSVCPVFGTPFDFSGCRGTWNFKNNAYPSLDRLNPDKGYVKDNIRLISWRANEIKHDSTLDELRAVVRWMESQGAVPGGH